MVQQIQWRATKVNPGLIYNIWRTIKGMWTDNTWNAKIKGGGQIDVFKILNGYENIDYNIFFSKLSKVK